MSGSRATRPGWATTVSAQVQPHGKTRPERDSPAPSFAQGAARSPWKTLFLAAARPMNTTTLAAEVVFALQHVAEALECLAATLPADRRATAERHAVEVRRSKAGIMAELM